MVEPDDEDASAASSAVVFAPISHPVLKSIDPEKVAHFLREREKYENEITEKKKENPSLTKASYKLSVEPKLLRNMHFLGELEAVAPGKALNSLTATDIMKWVKTLVVEESTDFDRTVIERALKGLRVNMKIGNAKARMLEYSCDMFNRLESVGYGAFKEKNPKMTVKLLTKYLYPKHFKDCIKEALEYQEALENDVLGFVEMLCEQAVGYDKFARKDKSTPTPAADAGVDPKDKKTNPKPVVNDPKKRPLCLNKECAAKGIHHYVTTECKLTSKKEAERLVREHKEKKAGGAKRVGRNDIESNSTLINATFGNKIERVICADNGSDVNLLPSDLLKKLEDAGADMKVRLYDTPKVYNLAVSAVSNGAPATLSCDREVVLDIQLFMRHSSFIELRNVKWYVPTTETPEPLLGRPVLEALGINTKELLMAARSRMGESVDLSGVSEYSEGSISRILSEGVYHGDRGLNDALYDTEEQWLELGIDTEAEMTEAILKSVEDAKLNGISAEGAETLHGILNEFRDVLRIRLGNDPPAKVDPMKIEIMENAKPFKAKARRYPPEAREYMDSFSDKILEYGFGKINTNAKWVSAPVIVPKAGPSKFRMTFDYRPVNAVTNQTVWPMPHIESELSDMAGSTCFASIDFPSGYWQLPLHEDSQEYLSFATANRIIQPTRCTQGAKNCTANFQSKVEPLFHKIRKSMKAWIDDFILHQKGEGKHLGTLRQFFLICRKNGLKVSIIKSQFFLLVVKWIGRIIDADGVKYDPRNLSGIQEMYLPINAAELLEYVHCMQWMSSAIPDFNERIEPFRLILEEAYAMSGARTKKSVQKIALRTLSWGTEHEALFREFQLNLQEVVKLAHRDTSKKLCVYTDASDEFWSAVVTQCAPEELMKLALDQSHEPLAFLGGAFRGPQERWSTPEKEGFAIYQVFERLDYLLLPERDTRIFTDHLNLLFIFNPLAIDSSLKKHIVNKVLRWSMTLSKFSYVIEHIPGEKNIMADIMTRWLKGYRGKRLAVKKISTVLQETDVVPSPEDEKFEWVTEDVIKEAQNSNEPPEKLKIDTDTSGLKNHNGKVWIPDESPELQLRLLVTAHCGHAGHRGAESTESILREKYYWSSMKEDVNEFTRACLHCIVGKTGHKIPRPISLTLHASKPNEVIHFDFLYMGHGIDEFKYILVIKDDLSSYMWLTSAKAADGETASNSLANWIRTFTPMKFWVSDQGSHFKNSVMEHLAENHNIKHQFTVAYSPWVNGTVEICMRQIQDAYRCIQSELKLAPHDWPTVVGMIQSILNESPLKRLGSKGPGVYRSPLEVMTGISPNRKHFSNTQVGKSKIKSKSLSKARLLQLLEINLLQEAFDGMHKTTTEKVSKSREKKIKMHNQKTNIISQTFNLGDFVLVRKAQNKGHKLSYRWIGPRRITKILGELVYEVENMVTGKIEAVHATRIQLYRSSAEGTEVSKKLMGHIEASEATYEIVDQFLKLSKSSGEFYVQTMWLGLPDKKDWTWQKLSELYEDMPDRVSEFLVNYKNKKLSNEAAGSIGITM